MESLAIFGPGADRYPAPDATLAPVGHVKQPMPLNDFAVKYVRLPSIFGISINTGESSWATFVSTEDGIYRLGDAVKRHVPPQELTRENTNSW